MDGKTVEVLISCNPVIYGECVVIQSVFRDITKMKVIEIENVELLKKIQAISTPIVPITKGISVLPLIGELDKDRCELLLETVPIKIAGTELDYLIVDFSGIYNLDQIVVESLHTLHQIVKLLGIQMIETGMRPELAIDLRGFGEDLFTIITTPTVMHALELLGINKKSGAITITSEHLIFV
jgi:rsbT co-antagonist protein RsbR